MGRVRRIALLMGQDAEFHRQVLRGIHAYGLQKRDWVFRDAPAELAIVPVVREWQPDGIIAHLVDGRFAKQILRLGKPVVDTGCVLQGLNVPVVDVDHEAVGRLAAEHFLERGYRHYGFYGSGTAYYSRLREASFRNQIEKAGFTVSSCHVEYLPRLVGPISWKRVDQQLRRWLEGLPKPVAILADHDVAAHDLANACQQMGLRVPEQVAILGVDNDELECQLAFPPISSVAIPAERIGYEAAWVLDRMLLGHPPPAKPLFLPPLRVVARQSTSILAVEDPLVAEALYIIRNNVDRRLKVAELANQLVIRRRALEAKFRQILGRSVLQEIHHARIEYAKQLLSETDWKLAQIARRCGFSTPQRLSVVFQKVAGMTPTEYRRQSQLQQRE
ncbi:MAG: XylR family transcriptional regulator [Thermoguttaceae bacterium]|nr:XylR family transcriptional regulator [Thermoguttaceae bacterium]MDW8037223.1 XylR family transcriptional regulator [Thermoguttaceae bacterium]